MEGMTRGYAARLVKQGITVNAIAPSLIETDMIRSGLASSPRIQARPFRHARGGRPHRHDVDRQRLHDRTDGGPVRRHVVQLIPRRSRRYRRPRLRQRMDDDRSGNGTRRSRHQRRQVRLDPGEAPAVRSRGTSMVIEYADRRHGGVVRGIDHIVGPEAGARR